MSQNRDPDYPEQDHIPQGGRDNPLGHARRYPRRQNGTPSSRGHGRRLLIMTVLAIVFFAWGIAGGLAVSMNSTAASTATATSKAVLSTSQIASRTDPGLADLVATDSYQQAAAAGTGIVLTSAGEVLTNNHVIEGATAVKVTDIGNGKSYTAMVAGYDAAQDVAVLQLQNASGLTTASQGDSATVQTGDRVAALGNAGGNGGTPAAVAGTVTALDQSITASNELSGASEQLTGLIQSNADIKAGDSGGPLVNSRGQVIGMDTAASSGHQPRAGRDAEQAYSIPINEALSIAEQIEAGTTSADVHIGATAFLGLEIAPSSGSSGTGFGEPSALNQGSMLGVTIAGTVSGSPTADAGLTTGDTITEVGGRSISMDWEITQALVPYHPGDKISITWVDQYHQSHTRTLTLTSGPAA